ncbi:hypothetical protein EU545_05820 [Candidatus Thorarchaeota archaeon]|nr:MAG: hypothetical protein EU545_05820 [Candidatus Thorarchaeota archaeon]
MAIEPGPGEPPIDEAPRDYRLSATGLVSRTIQLYGRRILEYITLIGLVGVLYTLLSLAVLWILYPTQAFDLVELVATDPLSVVLNLLLFAADPEQALGIVLVLMVIGMILLSASAGAAIKIALDDYGQPGASSLGDSLSYSVSRIVTLIGVQLLVSLISLAIFLPGFVFAFGIVLLILSGQLVALEMALLAILALIASLALLLYVNIRLSAALAVAMAEDEGAVNSVKRAWSLSGGNFWHIFGARVLLILVILVVGAVISVFFTDQIFGQWDVFASSLVVALLLNPLDYVFAAVLYRDLASREMGPTTETQDWW